MQQPVHTNVKKQGPGGVDAAATSTNAASLEAKRLLAYLTLSFFANTSFKQTQVLGPFYRTFFAGAISARMAALWLVTIPVAVRTACGQHTADSMLRVAGRCRAYTA
jgi:hypothetical protein